jgi:hypothetical protein
MPAAWASQEFPYVTPSHPHTGIYSLVQKINCGSPLQSEAIFSLLQEGEK